MADPLDDFHAHLDALAEASDVELTDDDRQAIFNLSSAQGFTPESTEAVFSDIYDYEDDSDFADDEEPEPEHVGAEAFRAHFTAGTSELEQQLGRSLSNRERDQLQAAALEDVMSDPNRMVTARTIANHLEETGIKPVGEMSRTEAVGWMTERAAEKVPQPDDSNREFDLDVRKDRQDWMFQRLNGVEFDETDTEA